MTEKEQVLATKTENSMYEKTDGKKLMDKKKEILFAYYFIEKLLKEKSEYKTLTFSSEHSWILEDLSDGGTEFERATLYEDTVDSVCIAIKDALWKELESNEERNLCRKCNRQCRWWSDENDAVVEINEGCKHFEK